MRVTMCAALLVISLVSVAAQIPPPRVPESPNPEAQALRGPRLGSPEIVKLGPGVRSPVLRKEVKPTYPKEMIVESIQGMVTMDCVVLDDGTIGEVKVTKSLHPALDKEAIATVRKWVLSPATVDGKPVPVQVEVEMQFTLRPRAK